MENETSVPKAKPQDIFDGEEGIFFSFDWTQATFKTSVGLQFVLRHRQEELAHRILNDPTLYKIGMFLTEIAEATEKRIPVRVLYVDGPKA